MDDDVMKKISGMLNGKKIPDNIQEMLNSVIANSKKENSNSNESDSKNSTASSNNDFSDIDLNTILKMQQVIKSMNTEQSNSRTTLLRSLKPYLKPNKQKKVEQYIQLFNMEKVIEMLNNGGDKK